MRPLTLKTIFPLEARWILSMFFATPELLRQCDSQLQPVEKNQRLPIANSRIP